MPTLDRPDSHAAGIPRYTDVAIALHWIIALAIIANIGFALLTEDLPRAARMQYMDWHKALGLTILALSVVRLVWRLMHRPPPLPAESPAWQNMAAHALHWLFYVLMIGIPIGGWLIVSTGKMAGPIDWFGLFDIPVLPTGPNAGLHETAEGLHKTLGIAMIPLILLHVGAALKHQFIDRDNLFARMRPVP